MHYKDASSICQGTALPPLYTEYARLDNSTTPSRLFLRCVYQWAVALEEGEESGEDLPDPPACNAPAPKAPAGGEDGEDDEDADGGDNDEGEPPAAAAWSGDDEDLMESAAKVHTWFRRLGGSLQDWITHFLPFFQSNFVENAVKVGACMRGSR